MVRRNNFSIWYNMETSSKKVFRSRILTGHPTSDYKISATQFNSIQSTQSSAIAENPRQLDPTTPLFSSRPSHSCEGVDAGGGRRRPQGPGRRREQVGVVQGWRRHPAAAAATAPPRRGGRARRRAAALRGVPRCLRRRRSRRRSTTGRHREDQVRSR